MTIHWPDRYAPERVAVRVRNEIIIGAAPDRVWPWLIRAADWPAWYPNSSDVRIEGGAKDLSAGARFTWRTFGVKVRSTVHAFEPYERIGWDGAGTLLDVYHAWLIEPRGRRLLGADRGKPEWPRGPGSGLVHAFPDARGARRLAGGFEGEGGGAALAGVAPGPHMVWWIASVRSLLVLIRVWMSLLISKSASASL